MWPKADKYFFWKNKYTRLIRLAIQNLVNWTLLVKIYNWDGRSSRSSVIIFRTYGRAHAKFVSDYLSLDVGTCVFVCLFVGTCWLKRKSQVIRPCSSGWHESRVGIYTSSTCTVYLHMPPTRIPRNRLTCFSNVIEKSKIPFACSIAACSKCGTTFRRRDWQITDIKLRQKCAEKPILR